MPENVDDVRRLYLRKVARTNALTLNLSVFISFGSIFFAAFGLLFVSISGIILMTVFFLYTNKLIASYMKRGFDAQTNFKEILNRRVFRFYFPPIIVTIPVMMVSQGISSAISFAVFVCLLSIYPARMYYVRRKRWALPHITDSKIELVQKVERVTKIQGITLLLDEKSSHMNLSLISWRKPAIILTRKADENLTDDELISVITHEIGHFKNKDILKKLAPLFADAAVTVALVLFLYFSRTPPIALLTLIAVCIPIVFVMNIYPALVSKKYEVRADRYCADMGFGTGLISALRKMNEFNRMPSRFPKGVILSHPDNETRLSLLEKQLAEQNSS